MPAITQHHVVCDHVLHHFFREMKGGRQRFGYREVCCDGLQEGHRGGCARAKPQGVTDAGDLSLTRARVWPDVCGC